MTDKTAMEKPPVNKRGLGLYKAIIEHIFSGGGGGGGGGDGCLRYGILTISLVATRTFDAFAGRRRILYVNFRHLSKT